MPRSAKEGKSFLPTEGTERVSGFRVSSGFDVKASNAEDAQKNPGSAGRILALRERKEVPARVPKNAARSKEKAKALGTEGTKDGENTIPRPRAPAAHGLSNGQIERIA
jgi:hypothetical protein